MSDPRRLVRDCLARGVHTLFITDHDTIDGSLVARAAAERTPLQVIVGAEYATDLGDVIGVFLREEVRSRSALKVVEEIIAQGGVAVLPHPYHQHPDLPELHDAVAAIEVFNARCSAVQNALAAELATRMKKPMVAGSDAHFGREVSNVLMRFRGSQPLEPHDLTSRERSWIGQSTKPEFVRASQVVKGVKRRTASLIVRAGLATLKRTRCAAASGVRPHTTVAGPGRRRQTEIAYDLAPWPFNAYASSRSSWPSNDLPTPSTHTFRFPFCGDVGLTQTERPDAPSMNEARAALSELLKSAAIRPSDEADAG